MTNRPDQSIGSVQLATPNQPPISTVSGFCQGKKKDGSPCKRRVKPGHTVCFQHAVGWMARWRAFTSNQQLVFLMGLVGVILTALGWLFPEFWKGSKEDIDAARRMPKLTQKDAVVLADFVNTTGDQVFDGTLRQGLSSQLEQSPFLNLISDDRIRETLALMSQQKDARLTHDLARQVCQRTGGVATIEGSIAKLGNQYVLGLKAINCATGDHLAEEQLTADSKENVLNTLGKAATIVRKRLGESSSSLERYDVPLENVTTSSLDALRAYSLGYALFDAKNVASAIPLFERAISLDPQFAMAYARLGTSYDNLRQTTKGATNTRKAYELRDKVSDREKFYIASHYEVSVLGDLEAARKTNEAWMQTYLRDYIPLDNLAHIYETFGDFPRALTLIQESLRLRPGSAINLTQLAFIHVFMNDPEKAKAVAQDAQARHQIDSPVMHFALFEAAFLQDDQEALKREEAALRGTPGYDDLLIYFDSNLAAYSGRFAKARDLEKLAMASALRSNDSDSAGVYEAGTAIHEALVGHFKVAARQAQHAIRLSESKNVRVQAGVALGLAGEISRAKTVADDLAKRFPDDTLVQSLGLPMIRAAVLLNRSDVRGRATAAFQELVRTGPYELGTEAALQPVYLRGIAALADHQADTAIAEFEKILENRAVVSADLIGALAHLQLARAYLMRGDQAKAKNAYRDFLDLWKDADSDLRILKAARIEYAKLS